MYNIKERNGDRMKDSVVAELTIKAQQGDAQAFEQLYTEFSPLIYSILLEITHDTYEAEDLTQDCFVSAFRNIHTIKDPLKTKKWLTAIAANHGKDYLKKKKPALLGTEHEYVFDIQEEKNESLLPDKSAILDERSKEIREIVNSVSEDKRLCLVLFYQHEMSITEISKELGISESAVKSRLFRAREDIREEVEKRNKKGMPLFGIAPLPLILFALQKSSQAAATSFAGSAAQTAAFAGVTAAVSQTGIAAASTAATATTAASATASAASTTATAATGIGAKVAAMSVAQKVVAGITAATIATGSATVTTVVVKNKIEAKEETTTAYVEEVTTAPAYSFESETVFVPAVAETESIVSENSSSSNSTSVKQSPTASQTKETEKSTSASSTTKTASTTKKTTTTKATTTKKETTTQKVTTTKATTTEEKTTTAKATTTKAVTTTRAATTTTTRAATTTTTKAASPATVTVTVWGEESSTTKTLYFEAGEKITATEIENRLSSEYGIEAIVDNINIMAEAGGSYTATAYE